MKFDFTHTSGSEHIDRRLGYIKRLSGSGGAFLSERFDGDCYVISLGGEQIGTLSLEDGALTGFYIRVEDYGAAQEAFDAAIETLGVTRARVLTADSPFMALCCERWKSAAAVAGCYELAFRVPAQSLVFLRCAKARDTQRLLDTGYFRREKLTALMKEHSVYVCESGDAIAAFGTIEPCRYVPDYAIIGVRVEEKHRFAGIGSSILSRLAAVCSDYGKKALAVCESDNTAYAHALKSAGFVCYDKLLEVRF